MSNTITTYTYGLSLLKFTVIQNYDICMYIHACFHVIRTTVLDSMKLGIDVNRHKEIIVKSISGLFLLLLKWFKLNHVYQVVAITVCLDDFS